MIKHKVQKAGHLFDELFSKFFGEIDKLDKEVKKEFKKIFNDIDIRRVNNKVVKVVIDGVEYVKKEKK